MNMKIGERIFFSVFFLLLLLLFRKGLLTILTFETFVKCVDIVNVLCVAGTVQFLLYAITLVPSMRNVSDWSRRRVRPERQDKLLWKKYYFHVVRYDYGSMFIS